MSSLVEYFFIVTKVSFTYQIHTLGYMWGSAIQIRFILAILVAVRFFQGRVARPMPNPPSPLSEFGSGNGRC